MSSRMPALIAVGAILLSIPLAATSNAQSFFEALFGNGAPQQSHQPRQVLPPSPYSHRAPLFDPHHRRDRSDDEDRRDRGGRFKTVCVRLCDGYYFPISTSARRSHFYRDADVCRSSCGEDAALFHISSSAAETTDMVDQQGKPYSSLPNAFKYRKTLVDGCKCKPEPWAQSETDRHARYAAEAAVAEQSRLAKLEAEKPRSKQQLAVALPPAMPPPAVVGGNYADSDKPEQPAEKVAIAPPSDPAVRELPPTVAVDVEPSKVAEEPKVQEPEPVQPLAAIPSPEPQRRARHEKRQEPAAHQEYKRQVRQKQASGNGGSGFLGLGGPKKGGSKWPGD